MVAKITIRAFHGEICVESTVIVVQLFTMFLDKRVGEGGRKHAERLGFSGSPS